MSNENFTIHFSEEIKIPEAETNTTEYHTNTRHEKAKISYLGF